MKHFAHLSLLAAIAAILLSLTACNRTEPPKINLNKSDSIRAMNAWVAGQPKAAK
jgi:hypothetical protein